MPGIGHALQLELRHVAIEAVDQHRQQRLVLLAPDHERRQPDGDELRRELQRCGTGQKILVDPQREVRLRYRVRQLPTSILIGPDLKVLEMLRGVPPLRDPAFHERVEKLVRSLAATPSK